MTGSSERPWLNLVAGLLLTVGGLIAARAVELPSGGLIEGTGGIPWVPLLLGLFLCGSFSWWLFVGRTQKPSLLRGALAGILCGILAYPVVLLIAELVRRPPPGIGILRRLLTALEVSAFALATTGFAAMFTMAVAGAVCALILRRVYPRRLRSLREAAGRLIWGLAAAAGVVALVLLAGFTWLTLLPLDKRGLTEPHVLAAPMNHEQALAAYQAVLAEEAKLPLNPRCASKLLTHGQREAQTIVFLHGVTNCPAQADELAPKLLGLGYNVYVPRLPGHGMADQMTDALVPITAEEYVAATEAAIEIGHGLGDEVIVVGLSAGGALTMWSAQYRADVRGTVAMAAFLGPNLVPAWANRAATNLLLILPSTMFTWNPLEPLGPPEMDYAYPRVPTRALGQFMRIGEVVADSARTVPPLAQGLGVMVNEADFAVNNALAKNIAKDWERHGREVDLKILPVSMRLLHDLIDPRQADANTELAYSLLLEMLPPRPACAGPPC